MDATDPVAYVRATPPFAALPRPLFDEAARALEVAFFPAGTWLVRAGGTPLAHLYVVRRGTVRLEREGQTVQVLEEGETFGYTSLITRQATLDAVVEEDLLAYLLPDAEFQRLRRDAGFAGHFAVGLAERLERALDHSPVVTFQADLAQEVRRLVRRPVAWVRADATVGEAARLMRAERISSVLVAGEPPGILTDRDLTHRVLAEGLGPDAPVERVLSRPLRTVSAEAPLYEAWAALLDAGVHHLPLAGRGGELVGVVTATDLLKSSAQGPVAVLRRVERLSGRDGLPGYAGKVAEMAAALVAGGLDALAVAGLVTRLNDALVARLLAWAEADLGPPPAPYAWLALGSEGRGEQTLLTDQDNALVYADGDAGAGYWGGLAERVNADLESAGFPPCPHGHMARAEHAPLSEWRRRFDACIDERRPLAAALLFDFRKVAGALDVSLLEAAVGRAARNPAFLRFLARAAVERKPPASLRLGAEGSVDLKSRGIAPVVLLARCYGLEVGAPARATLDRLRAAREAGLVSPTAYESVANAYRFLLGLRLRHQLRLLAEGRPVTSEARLSDLDALERTRLKDAFRAVKRWQDKAAFHYRTDFF